MCIIPVLTEYMVVCSKISQLPDLGFVIAGRSFTLKAEDYVLQISSGGQTQCLLGIMGLDMPAGHDELWILGDVFLRKYVSVYDVAKARVGFATAA